jgi:hypothetical protein
MPMPNERENVPRDQVHTVVKIMLQNPEVGNIDCVEQTNSNYTIKPHQRNAISARDTD